MTKELECGVSGSSFFCCANEIGFEQDDVTVGQDAIRLQLVQVLEQGLAHVRERKRVVAKGRHSR